jgi:ferredoxin-thioredoxin reductase catalytic subunit/rubredoxin
MSGSEQAAIMALYEKIVKDAESSGYHINPDKAFVMSLMEGLAANSERYGYLACPCRLADGEKAADLDIVCPCDYRDPDLTDFGACFCALYVSAEIARGEKEVESIPDRRPVNRETSVEPSVKSVSPSELPYPVWRCKVCGYLCARNEPPETCPICKVKKERFERFI